ncbi:retrotransposon protein, putative, ty1-copia subclass [Tanacetum coccineum]
MIQELRSMFEKQAGVEKFDLIQSFHACKQEEGKSVADYVLKMKGYVEQLERLGYMLPQDISVGLILNGLTKLFLGFRRGSPVGSTSSSDLRIDKEAKQEVSLLTLSRQGASYFITFTDDYSRYGYVYLLKHKHEVFETFKVFKNEVENQLGKTIKAIRSDRGGEYISQELKDYLKANGIVQQLTPPYTSQHNGVSERRNRTLLDMVRSMMNLTTLPLSFWDYALESATHILNMVPTKKVDKTPYELWYGKVPNLSYLKVWGCEALVKRDTPDKLEQRSVKYAKFFEKRLISQEISGRAVDLKEIQEEEDTTPSEITSNIPQEVEEVEEHSLGDLNEPTSYKAAMLNLKSNKWIDAMNEEIQSMMDNMVWVMVDLPPGCKTVGTKGYTQLYGVDYEETFSLVADIRAIRILISIAAYYDYEIWQMDVKTAFLNGYLDEDIYMV